MVAGLQSDLAQIGVDVARETEKNSLVFSSHLGHLSEDQTFDVDRMIAALEDALNQTLRDGYVRLAGPAGDVAWEFGPKVDFGQPSNMKRELKILCALTRKSREYANTKPALCLPTQCRPVMKCIPRFSSMRLISIVSGLQGKEPSRAYDIA